MIYGIQTKAQEERQILSFHSTCNALFQVKVLILCEIDRKRIVDSITDRIHRELDLCISGHVHSERDLNDHFAWFKLELIRDLQIDL